MALASVFYSCPHLLVLDEPSNHLDLEGVECLAVALGQYQGAVLLVSHDQVRCSSARRMHPKVHVGVDVWGVDVEVGMGVRWVGG